MYSAWWLLTILGVAITIAAGTSNSIDVVYKCPIGCNCSDTSATCSTLDIEKFSSKIYTLKISNPTSALYFGVNILRKLGLESINTLIIENAVIDGIDKNAFKDLQSLTNIKIVNSNIPDIHPDTFVDCANLQRVNFAGSYLHKFDSIKSQSIEELDISNCSIQNIANTSFDNLSELTYLNLAHNFIDHIDLNTFSDVINLEELNLSHNYISEIPFNLFENNTELNTLDLSYNPLKEFRTSSILSLEKLVLKSCKLTKLDPSTTKYLDLLDTLDLSGNNISILQPGTFSALTELQVLDLSNNNIGFLHPDTFKHNTNLQKLVLDDNPMKFLPAFNTPHNQIFKIYYFSCNNCQLKSLAENTFLNMSAIVTLNLANNDLTNIKALQHLRSLNELDLSNNLIKNIDKTVFEKNQALESLNLSGNTLRTLNSSIFLNNAVLKKLDVSNCGLQKLWTVTEPSLFSVVHLNARNNLLRSVSQAELTTTPNLKVMEIKGNPLACDESFCDFIGWINDREIIQPSVASKTHEPVRDAAEFELTDKLSSWSDVVNATCGGYDVCLDYDDDDEIDEDQNSEEYPEDGKIDIDFRIDVNDISEEEEDETEEDPDRAVPTIFRSMRSFYVWPCLVFIFTAVLVLLSVASVLLLLLKRRGVIQVPREGLPQIKIIPWSSACKLKKHSGSVYQPLSEETYGPPTPKLNRYEKLPSEPAVHKPTP